VQVWCATAQRASVREDAVRMLKSTRERVIAALTAPAVVPDVPAEAGAGHAAAP
jgi:hypothetical protein